MSIRSKLGYTAAALTIVCAVLIPFLLIDVFSRGVAATGVHVDDVYGGGKIVRTIEKGAYKIQVYETIHPHALQRDQPFLQIAWTPVSALPPRVSDEVDIDGDGYPDLRATFAVPRDEKTALSVDVEPLHPGIEAMHGVTRKGSFDQLIARVNNQILVRVRLTN
jgi:hypothetical protein